MAKLVWIGLTALVLLISTPGLDAQGQGRGKGKGNEGARAAQGDDHGDNKGLHRGEKNKSEAHQKAVKAFAKNDRDVIIGFFQEQPGGLPPGLAKRDRLPPGLEKQLRRNGHLPNGLEDKIHPFPSGLAVLFPPLEPGYHRGLVGGLAVIYQQGGLIVDLIDLR